MDRKKILKESLKNIGIGSLAVTATLLFSPVDVVNLRGVELTPEEYGQIKGQVIEKFKNQDKTLLTFPELQAWSEVVGKEVAKCDKKYVFKGKDTKKMLTEFNKIAEFGCKDYK